MIKTQSLNVFFEYQKNLFRSSLDKLLQLRKKCNGMVYTDGAHLTADSLDELYGYAHKIGLNPEWIDFMGRTIHPHFNICGHVKRRVLADLNVQKVTCKEIVRLCILNFRLPQTEKQIREWEQHHKQRLSDLPKPSEFDYKRMVDNILKRTGIKTT